MYLTLACYFLQKAASHNKQRRRKSRKKAPSNCGNRKPKRRGAARLTRLQSLDHHAAAAGVLRRNAPNARPRHTKHGGAHSKRMRHNHRKRSNGSSADVHSRSRRSVSRPNYVEALVVADASMVAFHQEGDIETYLLTIMNMVSSLYKDPAIGNLVKVVVVRIVLVEEDEAHHDFNVTTDAKQSLHSFCR